MIEEKRSEEAVFSFVMHGWFTLCIFSLFSTILCNFNRRGFVISTPDFII